MSKRARPLPGALVRARERFDEWRRTRQRRTIPESLWTLATELAVEHGSHRTARALGLNTDSLKKRVGAAGESVRASLPEEPPFLSFEASELVAGFGSSECAVELEDSRGARMRIRWKGSSTAPDLAALVRSLFGGATS